MENIAQWVGIDVSKAALDVYIRPIGKAMQAANTESEISNLVELLLSYNLNLIVLEATGGLETELIIQLQASQLPVALINPRQGRDFAKATGRLAKTELSLVNVRIPWVNFLCSFCLHQRSRN